QPRRRVVPQSAVQHRARICGNAARRSDEEVDEERLEGRIRRVRSVERAADSCREVQGALWARSDRWRNEPGLHLSVTRWRLPVDGTRHRRRGAWPVLQTRTELLGWRVSARRRAFAYLENYSEPGNYRRRGRCYRRRPGHRRRLSKIWTEHFEGLRT